MPKLIYKNYIKNIKILYKEGLNCKNIANRLNLHPVTISKIAKSIGLNFFRGNKCRRIHEINENYFSLIDTEEKAYFLGLLYADGCVSLLNHRSWRMKLALWEPDKYIIEYLVNLIFLKPETYKIYTRKSDKITVSNFCSVNVFSKKLCNDLIKLGCIQRKSLVLKFPTSEQVPDHLIHHFIRGYFDGDGCFTIRKKIFSISFSFVSSNDFIKGLQKTLSKYGILSNSYQHSKQSPLNSILRNSRIKNVLKFYDFIYKDCSVFIKRKKNTIENYLYSNLEYIKSHKLLDKKELEKIEVFRHNLPID